jgi:hypothetical protein
MKVCSLHDSQHAYRPGRSTTSALQHVTSLAEQEMFRGKYVIGVFLDISGAFDSTKTPYIMGSLDRFMVPGIIQKWIGNLLQTRTAVAEVGSASYAVRATRGFPQGGVLSPFLWCLVVDSLLCGLNKSTRLRCTAYSDDLVLMSASTYLEVIYLP